MMTAVESIVLFLVFPAALGALVSTVSHGSRRAINGHDDKASDSMARASSTGRASVVNRIRVLGGATACVENATEPETGLRLATGAPITWLECR